MAGSPARENTATASGSQSNVARLEKQVALLQDKLANAEDEFAALYAKSLKNDAKEQERVSRHHKAVNQLQKKVLAEAEIRRQLQRKLDDKDAPLSAALSEKEVAWAAERERQEEAKGEADRSVTLGAGRGKRAAGKGEVETDGAARALGSAGKSGEVQSSKGREGKPWASSLTRSNAPASLRGGRKLRLGDGVGTPILHSFPTVPSRPPHPPLDAACASASHDLQSLSSAQKAIAAKRQKRKRTRCDFTSCKRRWSVP